MSCRTNGLGLLILETFLLSSLPRISTHTGVCPHKTVTSLLLHFRGRLLSRSSSPVYNFRTPACGGLPRLATVIRRTGGTPENAVSWIIFWTVTVLKVNFPIALGTVKDTPPTSPPNAASPSDRRLVPPARPTTPPSPLMTPPSARPLTLVPRAHPQYDATLLLIIHISPVFYLVCQSSLLCAVPSPLMRASWCVLIMIILTISCPRNPAGGYWA